MLSGAISASSFKQLPTINASSYNSHSPILTMSDSSFTSTSGVTTGSGTAIDPYIIQGWDILATTSNAITITGTTAHFVIRDCYLHSGYVGVLLRGVSNGTIQNTSVQNNGAGINIDHSKGIAILGSDISSNTNYGIVIGYSDKVTVSTNKLSTNNYSVYSFSSSNVTIASNTVSKNEFGIKTDNASNVIIGYNIISGNKGDSLRLSSNYSIMSKSTVANGNTSQLGVGDNQSVSVTGYDLSFVQNNVSSIPSTGNIATSLAANHNLTVSGNSFSGSLAIDLNPQPQSPPPNIKLNGNTFFSGGIDVTSCGYAYSLTPCGYIVISPDNTVYGQPVVLYSNCNRLDINGIQTGELIVVGCRNSRIENLNIKYGYIGIQLADVNDTIITGNTIVSNFGSGISTKLSHNITIVSNNISNNANYALQFALNPPTLYFTTPQTATVYHNNFVYNDAYALIPQGGSGTTPIEKSDNGYPTGGNFWADYNGIDHCSGPAQDICPNPDGIGDTAYQADKYPLMKPYGLPDGIPPSWSAKWKSLVVSNSTPTGLTLSWSRAYDDVGVFRYRIYRGNTLLATVPGNIYSYNDNGLSPTTTYTYSVQAGDWADTWSNDGPILTVTTSPPPAALSIPYWYLVVPSVVVAIALPAVYFWRRSKLSRLAPKKAEPETQAIPSPKNSQQSESRFSQPKIFPKGVRLMANMIWPRLGANTPCRTRQESANTV